MIDWTFVVRATWAGETAEAEIDPASITQARAATKDFQR